jgi:DNA-binding XRE family transcriptional regulator
MERGRKALEAARQVLEPSLEDVARKARFDEFEKKLHETAMGILDRLSGAPTSISGPAAFRSYGKEFKQLGDEETRIILATKKERLLADCYFDLTPTLEQATMPELRKGPDEHLKTRFEALATKAGIALGCATRVAPLKFWLFELFLYLSEIKSRYLFAPASRVRIGDNPQSDLLKAHAGEIMSNPGGIITNVYEASANFCLWLEKQALEAEHRRGGVGANQAQSSRGQNSPNSARSVESKSTNGATAIGRNIDKLRKECGWSLDKLAKETGIDKKSIISHVNKGVRPIPRILKEYAQAFSKALDRKITAPDLEN